MNEPTPEERQAIEAILADCWTNKAKIEYRQYHPNVLAARRYAQQVTAELRQRAETAEKELGDELGRWQQAIYEQLGKACPGLNIDGAGSDSGDPLDFTQSEIAQVVNYFTDQLATAQARIKELEADKNNPKNLFKTVDTITKT